MAAQERRCPSTGSIVRAPVAGPSARRQLKGLALILLICGQEVNAWGSLRRPEEAEAVPQPNVTHSSGNARWQGSHDLDVSAVTSNLDLPSSGSQNASWSAGFVTWDYPVRTDVPASTPSVVARRMTAVQVKFTIEVSALAASNLLSQGPSTTNVVVHAGILYFKLKIQALSGLGTDPKLVKVKLVPYDFAATLATCQDVTSIMGIPFDGTINQLDPGPDEGLNEFSNAQKGFSFPLAGEWRLCYTYNGVNWEELAPKITVVGSETQKTKIWCAVSLLTREVCQNFPATNPGCECMGKVEGFKINNMTNKLTTLGLPNPNFPPWTASLTEVSYECGNRFFEPMQEKISIVTNYEGYEIHNFGTRRGGTTFGVWKLCYCVGFDFDDDMGACYKEAPTDFQQYIGSLVTVDIQTKLGTNVITVYPTLRFSIVLECGTTHLMSTPNSPGGCTASDVVRYKIVEQKNENNLPYFDSGAGCRFLPQVETEIIASKTLGGQLGPDNCISPVNCQDKPEKLSQLIPTWDDVQIDASYENNVMMDRTYDICYCDGSCLNSMFWFKAGAITVKPIKVFFSEDENTKALPIVNTMYYVIIEGSSHDGSWTTTGANTREMKILRDNDGIVDKIACLTEPQPNVVSGHRLVNGNTDYTEPSETRKNGASRPIGMMYGKVFTIKNADGTGVPSSKQPNIKILEPGWYAVCYCDSNCNEMLNWSVYGRSLVKGPIVGQQWQRYVGVTFDLDITGWNLGVDDRVRVLSTVNELGDCGTTAQSDRVFGPDGKANLKSRASGSQPVLIDSMSYDSRGTQISFSRLHGLKDGDRIKLEGVNAPTTKQNEMYNRIHEIFVSCDDEATLCFKILIPVRFPAAEFPVLRWDSATWTRTSIETLKNIRISKASPEGRGYIVCWSPLRTEDAAFVGQAGKIVVKDAIEMPLAQLGLTTVMPDVPAGGGPVMIYFETGDIARYAQAEGPLQLIVTFMSAKEFGNTGSYRPGLEARNYALQPLSVNVENNEIGEETQAVCGQLFTEMWSEDSDGFPMPKGCYYSEDTVNPAQTLGQLHIVFSPKNHLKKKTKYILVMNAQVKKELKFDFPSDNEVDGAVYVWSMDDVYKDPFRVIELGRAKPAPENRVPPRDSTTGLLLLNSGDDGKFEPQQGFKIFGNDDLHFGNGVLEMRSHCLAFNPAKADSTPHVDDQCKLCYTEEDCNNHDPSQTWCVAPIDTTCPQAAGSATAYPAFTFQLMANFGNPIKSGSLLRIFMQPLTAWNMKTACAAEALECQAPGGVGSCGPYVCVAESVIGGTVFSDSVYPVNVIKLTLPSIMADITSTVKHTVAIGGLPLPKGGFLPQAITAEIMKDIGTAPDYWDLNSVATGGAKLYVRPKVISASLVTQLGDGNTMPFVKDRGNVVYIRMVIGATLFSSLGDGISLQFKLPFGYKCDIPPEGLIVPPLGVIGDVVPTYQGRLGGIPETETYWVREVSQIVACTMVFREYMVYYGYAVVFLAVRVNNPQTAMKTMDLANKWELVVKQVADKIDLPPFILKAPFVTPTTVMPGYGGSVPTLGKLTNIIITPSNLGLGQQNTMDVFFRTEQEVGTVLDVMAEIWVDGPPGFDFGRYCGAYQLPDNYYIPEPVEKTFRLPVGPLIECNGVPATSSDLTYNRAKVKTQGRLLKLSTYGFRLVVTNTASYIRSQLDQWKIWTYLSSIQAGVDGAFTTARFNERVQAGPDTSFGCYSLAMKPGALQISIANLRPTVGSIKPTDITFLPIIVQVPMQKAVRILAPAGYQWDFLQTEFRYKAPGRGVPPEQVVAGAEQDLPITGVPASPVSEPRNRLAIDYMQAEWIPGVKYGFIAKIRIPVISPTKTGNFFSIEFGYDGLIQKDRLEAGIVLAPLVRRIINGRIGFTTSIIGRVSEIQFDMQLITKVPRAGGLVITGPPNFEFEKFCQPKPVGNYPEMPYDSTCMFRQDPATGQLEISIIAGPSGIPPAFYRFSLLGKNPPQPVSFANRGTWSFNSYGVISEMDMLDYPTNVSGYSVNTKMISATVVAPPKRDPECWFLSMADRADSGPGRDITDCGFEDWQFPAPNHEGGTRDDRPNQPSSMVFKMQLNKNSGNNLEVVVRAPEGYEFNTECKVVVDSSAVFNDTNIGGDGQVPKGFIKKFAIWPAGTTASNCYGSGNIARITLTCTDVCLSQSNSYVFRLHILKNPPATPSPNMFMLEYNGEGSEPFEGVKIWAFNNVTIIPTTTASSLRSRPTINNVTVTLRPTNSLATGGHLRIEAPAGYVMQTNCRATVRIHKDETPNITATPAGPDREALLLWADFATAGDFRCEGDVTMSSRSRLHFTERGKYLKAGVLYEFVFETTNPQTTTPFRAPWTFSSFKDSTPNFIIDTATIDGFPINDAAPTFFYMTPNSINALARQLLEFNMSFPQDVIMGDMVEIVAPITFYFSEDGDNRCPDYQVLDGSMRKTVPACGANTMTWELSEEMVPMRTSIRFLVRVKNPPSTPIKNLFQVRQISSTGKRKSSRMIPGYAIIPELSGVSVQLVPPEASTDRSEPGYCRPTVAKVTEKNCTAAGSHGSVFVVFSPLKPAELVQIRGHVDGNPFDFSEASFPSSPSQTYQEYIDTNARDATQITAKLAVRPGTPVQLLVSGIRWSTPGVAKFSVTTFSGDAPTVKSRIDEKLDLPSFEVLQYIDMASPARVNPIYYGSRNAKVTFELVPMMDLLVHDVFRITRPDEFTFKSGTFLPFRDLKISEQGLDTDRVWMPAEPALPAGAVTTASPSGTSAAEEYYMNPSNYYVVIAKVVRAGTRILWTLTVDLPEAGVAPQKKFWYFSTYRILPQRDTDGEILDATALPYPWIGRNGERREIMPIGTNDGAFEGFLLVASLPFRILPERKTPGAIIRLSVNFKLPSEQKSLESGGYIRMEVTAPSGFVFKDNCFMSNSAVFRKCTGYRATATLVSIGKAVAATNMTLHLAVTNPGATPGKNTWSVGVFIDDAKMYTNWSPGPGFEILPMTVVYRGNNQLAVKDTGFFDFTPMQKSLSEVLNIVVVPPPGQGYRLLCEGVEQLGFQGSPVCESGSTDANLKLRFSNGTLASGQRYTLGVGILNPGGKPPKADNKWGILLQDHNKVTFDGNMRVQGLELKSIPIRAGAPFMGWLTPTPRVMNTVSMQFRVLHLIPAAMITKIVIGAPYGVRFMEDPSAVKVAPVPLPLFEANPSEVANPADVPNSAGPLLLLNLDVTQDIAEGTYNIRFECSNPGETKWDNTWSIIVMKDIEVEFSHYNVGFYDKQDSPYEVTGGGGGGGSGTGVTSHSSRQHRSGVFASIACAGLLTYIAAW